MDYPSSVVVTGPLNTAETDYKYDENNGSPQGSFGNLTTVSRVLNTSSSPVVSRTVYNADGTATQTSDANGNVSQVNSFQCNGLFPQSTTIAYGTSVAETSSQQRDCNTGAITSSTDPNGVLATLQHDDSLGRLTQTNHAVGTAVENHTAYTYPTPNEVTTAQDKSTKGDGAIKTTATTDGLGRTIQQVQPSGVIIDTTYDAVGNIASVSNPHFATASATDGITSFAYDALGRRTLQCNPDNGNNMPCQPGLSSKQWSYNGPTTTLTDEVGNTVIQTKDGLERLTKVIEPGSLQTFYTYDALGNLWSVNQAGTGTDVPRQRSFSYDSLSRLLTATNPETGTTCYGHGNGTVAGCQADGYDGNGNLQYKTDARGLTVSYRYDPLNRLIAKGASDGSFSYSYGYDDPAKSYGIGRLTHSSNNVNGGSDYYYDAMGRVTAKLVCVPTNCKYYDGGYASYDLAGNMTNSHTTSGADVGSSFDAAGRLSGSTFFNAGMAAPIALRSNLVYGPVGLNQAQLGNGLREETGYDTRMRVNAFSVSPSSSPQSGGYPPTGYIDHAWNAFSQQPSLPQGGLLQASGWAVDQEDGAPVAQVILLVDGKPAGEATLGGVRLDVANAFNRPDWTNSGWILTVPTSNLALGQHVASLKISDSSGNWSNGQDQQTFTITSDAAPTVHVESVIGTANQSSSLPQGGLLHVDGWAFDNEDGAPIAKVQVLLDGTVIGEAVVGGSRPDVANVYGSRFVNSG